VKSLEEQQTKNNMAAVVATPKHEGEGEGGRGLCKAAVLMGPQFTLACSHLLHLDLKCRLAFSVVASAKQQPFEEKGAVRSGEKGCRAQWGEGVPCAEGRPPKLITSRTPEWQTGTLDAGH
jgi:hypothetical protein